MADTKISALTALTGANVDETADVLPIVDTSVTTTKKILVSELFTLTGASPQITLGKLNTTSGGIKFFGSTSGNVTLAPNVAAGASVTVTLPATSVTLNAAGDLTGTTLVSSVVTSSLTTVGALNSGSITSGFGSIDVGADAISGGAITGTTVNDDITRKQFVTVGTSWTTIATVTSISGNWQGVVAVVKLANPMSSGSGGTVTYSLALVNNQASAIRATSIAGSDMTGFVQVSLSTGSFTVQIRGDSADASARTYAELSIFGASYGTSGQPTVTW